MLLAKEEEGVTELIESVVTIKRVAKVTKGGRTFRISAWVVVGDGQGTVGIGHGKAHETPDAIQKAIKRAKKNLKRVVIINGTLPHEVLGKMGASKVLLKPAAPGTGIIAPQPVRAILETAGYQNALTKSLGSNNPVNMMKATMKALISLKDPKKVAKVRGKDISVLMRRYGREKTENKTGKEPNRKTQEGKENT